MGKGSARKRRLSPSLSVKEALEFTPPTTDPPGRPGCGLRTFSLNRRPRLMHGPVPGRRARDRCYWRNGTGEGPALRRFRQKGLERGQGSHRRRMGEPNRGCWRRRGLNRMRSGIPVEDRMGMWLGRLGPLRMDRTVVGRRERVGETPGRLVGVLELRPFKPAPPRRVETPSRGHAGI